MIAALVSILVLWSGSGWVTVRAQGVAFPFPAYLESAGSEIDSRFVPSSLGMAHVDVAFVIRRDGSMVPGSMMFITRSGDFTIDIAAQQAVEQATGARAFGPLPAGFTGDVLPVVATFGNPSAVAEIAKGPTGPFAPRAQPSPDSVLFQFQVDKPALLRDGAPFPQYPPELESSRVEGELLVQFVVDTLGRVDMATFKSLKPGNEAFLSEIRKVLPRYRYYPAEVGGKKVKQYVQSFFSFKAP